MRHSGAVTTELLQTAPPPGAAGVRPNERGKHDLAAVRGGAEAHLSRTARATIALAVLAILAATLFPSSESEAPGWVSCWVCGKRGVADIILNVVLFMPLGAALTLTGVRPWRIWLLGALFSAGIEYTQLFIPGRESSVADVISNSTGALAGCVVALVLARTVRDTKRPSPLYAVATSGLVLGVITGTGILLQPAFPASTYFGQLTPALAGLEWYRGQVLEVSLDGVPLPSKRLADSPRIRQLLSAGGTLRVRALARPTATALAPLFRIADNRRREILLLGPDWDDLVFRYRPRAASWRLDRPDLRLAGAMRSVTRGDTLDVAVWRNGHGYCLTLNAAGSCHLGFTVGDGWALLMYPEALPPWLRTLLGIGWAAGLLLPVGYWSGSRWGLVVGVGTTILGLAIVAPAIGLLTTPVPVSAGAAFGFVAGAGGRELLIRRRRGAQALTTPDSSIRASSRKQRSILA